MSVLELVNLLTGRKDIQPAISKIESYIRKIEKTEILIPSENFASFRGYEGMMSKVYFQLMSELIPSQYAFPKRSQHPALDAFNCLLNYAYGMLYGLCESAMLKVGIDPYIGIMHRDEYNRPVFVYDFIELFRYWADYVVAHLCLQEVISDDFFVVEKKQYYLNDIGKRILVQSFNDYLGEIITLNGIQRTRSYHIEFQAQKVASLFKSFSPQK